MAELSPSTRIHIVGIGGAGMSAIAMVLRGMGHPVSGSDLADSPLLDRLRAEGVVVKVGHDAAHVSGADLVAVSTAIGDDNPEVIAARHGGIPVMRRAEITAYLTSLKPTVAVAGTHGKTTTAAMLAHLLLAVGVDPSFIVGGVLVDRGSGGRWSDGQWLVVEADESDGTFVELASNWAILTSVEPDHLSHHGSADQMEAAFARFCQGVSDGLMVCTDDPGAVKAATGCDSISYGTGPAADYRWCPLKSSGGVTEGEVTGPDGLLGRMVVPMPGDHNALNAVGAMAMAHHLGVNWQDAAEALGSFKGVSRRFERRGEVGGVSFIDDYAHLPTEVSYALKAAADGEWNRVVCAFQPHRFTRTSHLWPDFAHCFSLADVLVLTDIYSAGEPAIPGVSGELIYQAVVEANPEQEVHYVTGLGDVAHRLAELLQPGDLCLTLGAGDLTEVPDQVIGLLSGGSSGGRA